MQPLEPTQPIPPQNESPMAPPYVDENPNLEMTEKGLRIAENERRDAVREAYEKEALDSDDVSESLDDISYPDGSDDSMAPEISAMKERSTPDA